MKVSLFPACRNLYRLQRPSFQRPTFLCPECGGEIFLSSSHSEWDEITSNIKLSSEQLAVIRGTISTYGIFTIAS